MVSLSKCNFRSLTAAFTAADNCAVPPLSAGRQACLATSECRVSPRQGDQDLLLPKGPGPKTRPKAPTLGRTVVRFYNRRDNSS